MTARRPRTTTIIVTRDDSDAAIRRMLRAMKPGTKIETFDDATFSRLARLAGWPQHTWPKATTPKTPRKKRRRAGQGAS